MAGAGRGFDRQVCLAIGTGLGGAIVRGGELHRGQRGRAAELGHLAFNENGPLCGCTGRGCVEQYISQTGLMRQAAEAGWGDGQLQPSDVPRLFEAARSGDRVAAAIIDRAADALGFALAWCDQVLAPQCFVLAGGVSQAWPQLRERALAGLSRHAGNRPLPEVRIGSLGTDAGIIGGALLRRG